MSSKVSARVRRHLYPRVKRAAAARGVGIALRDEQHFSRRVQVLDRYGVDLVLDVGANKGQYADLLRRNGYRGDIVSFEPSPDAYAALCHRRSDDARWSGHAVAVGAENGNATFNVSADSVTSSLLNPSEALTTALAGSRVVETIDVPVRALDGLVPDLSGRTVMLKLDVQGFEREALAGAKSVLRHAVVLEVELSMIPTYEGAALIYDLMPELHAEGFFIAAMDPGHFDTKALQLLDADFLMVRLDGTRA